MRVLFPLSGTITQLNLMRGLIVLLLLLASAAGSSSSDVRPSVSTEAVAEDPDDPAIWIHPRDWSRSLILGTNKKAAPAGALVAFDLGGKSRQVISGIDRPNNVDVEYGLPLGGKPTDIAVLTERLKRRLRVFRIDPESGNLTDAGAIPVFDGETGEAAAPLGIALYKRPRDGAIFAIVGRKTGPRQGYLWQYRLQDDGTGKVEGAKVREFGSFSGGTEAEIEAIAVDDELGYVYYADEGDGIHKWHADPDHRDAGRELAHFGTDGFKADREGIAIYTLPRGKGYILCTDQLVGSSEYRIYPREGAPGNPHDHSQLIKVVRGPADSTDGLEATSAALGPQFPSGLVVAMNSAGKNFLLFRWEDFASSGTPQLKVHRGGRPKVNPF